MPRTISPLTENCRGGKVGEICGIDDDQSKNDDIAIDEDEEHDEALRIVDAAESAEVPPPPAPWA